jgi:aminopeptidase YwaD
MKHIAYLSETIGPRPGGMEAEWQGARYIASVLESFEYEVELQPFPISDQYVGSVELTSGARWQMNAAPNGLITGEEFISGELIQVPSGLSPSDFLPETAGSIVLMKREQQAGHYRIQVGNAEDAGAIGVILFNPIRFRGDYGGAWVPHIEATDIPVLGASWNQGEWLQDMLAQGPGTLSVQTKRYEDLESVNVVGVKPAKNGDPDADAVLVTAHLDSVVGSPGANDNASGVAVALELARAFRNFNTDRELRFVMFGSEEKAPYFLGSRYYVDQLSDEELGRILGVFNVDGVGKPGPESARLLTLTVDGLPNLVTDSAEAAGSRLGNSSILPARSRDSDHVPFHRAGTPAAGFYWAGVWRFYHTPQDTIADSVSLRKIQGALDIVGAAVFDLIRKEVSALENSRVRADE